MKKDHDREKTIAIVSEAFLELTLSLEAIFLIHGADEDLVEAIIRNMEEVYRDALRNLKSRQGRKKTYPAVERFLGRLAPGRYAPQENLTDPS
jgi:hypothetical protein